MTYLQTLTPLPAVLVLGCALSFLGLAACGSGDSGPDRSPDAGMLSLDADVGEPDVHMSDEDAAAILTATTAFYYGTVTVTSPDGTTPYAAYHSLIKRQVRPSEDLIVEEVLQDDGELTHSVTELRRRPDTAVFDATDGETFTGTLEYSGPEWDWDQWTYAIVLSDGSGRLGGTGSLGPDGIMTNKVFFDDEDIERARIVEVLAPTTAEEFDRRRDLPAPWGE